MSATTRLAGFVPLLLVMGTALAGMQTRPAGKEAAEKADYYPLRLGNKWHAQIVVNGQMMKAVSQIANIEKIDGRSIACLEVTLVGEAITSNEHLSSSEKGIFRHRMDGKEIDPPLCLLKYPIKEGDSWQVDTKVGGQKGPMKCTVGKWEQIEVPAGKFKAIPVRVTVEENGKPLEADYWFAAGVGVVMQSREGRGFKITVKLEKFEEGKNPNGKRWLCR